MGLTRSRGSHTQEPGVGAPAISECSSSYTSSLLKDPEACSSHFRWDSAHGHYLQKQASTHSPELLGSDTTAKIQEHPPHRVLQRF